VAFAAEETRASIVVHWLGGASHRMTATGLQASYLKAMKRDDSGVVHLVFADSPGRFHLSRIRGEAVETDSAWGGYPSTFALDRSGAEYVLLAGLPGNINESPSNERFWRAFLLVATPTPAPFVDIGKGRIIAFIPPRGRDSIPWEIAVTCMDENGVNWIAGRGNALSEIRVLSKR
jgi:hypothetical protein